MAGLKQEKIPWFEEKFGLLKLQVTQSPACTRPTIEPPPLEWSDWDKAEVDGSAPTSSTIEPRPLVHAHSRPVDVGGLKQSPLPALAWADSSDIWKGMRSKDTSIVVPEAQLLLRHPCILPIMRSRLLESLMKICEFFHVHRETFYLALDIYDRFMDTQYNVQKEYLELIGTTCLYIACKLEETLLIKLDDFLQVSLGACTACELLKMEMFICNSLDWRLRHQVTVNSWMSIYLQIFSHEFRPPGALFEYPAFSQESFVTVMKILDLSCLDIYSRHFGSSVLSAAAYYVMGTRSEFILKKVTGYALADIKKCVDWLRPFLLVIFQQGMHTMPDMEEVSPKDVHNIQVCNVTTEMLGEVMELRKRQEKASGTSISPTREL